MRVVDSVFLVSLGAETWLPGDLGVSFARPFKKPSIARGIVQRSNAGGFFSCRSYVVYDKIDTRQMPLPCKIDDQPQAGG